MFRTERESSSGSSSSLSSTGSINDLKAKYDLDPKVTSKVKPQNPSGLSPVPNRSNNDNALKNDAKNDDITKHSAASIDGKNNDYPDTAHGLPGAVATPRVDTQAPVSYETQIANGGEGNGDEPSSKVTYGADKVVNPTKSRVTELAAESTNDNNKQNTYYIQDTADFADSSPVSEIVHKQDPDSGEPSTAVPNKPDSNSALAENTSATSKSPNQEQSLPTRTVPENNHNTSRRGSTSSTSSSDSGSTYSSDSRSSSNHSSNQITNSNQSDNAITKTVPKSESDKHDEIPDHSNTKGLKLITPDAYAVAPDNGGEQYDQNFSKEQHGRRDSTSSSSSSGSSSYSGSSTSSQSSHRSIDKANIENHEHIVNHDNNGPLTEQLITDDTLRKTEEPAKFETTHDTNNSVNKHNHTIESTSLDNANTGANKHGVKPDIPIANHADVNQPAMEQPAIPRIAPNHQKQDGKPDILITNQAYINQQTVAPVAPNHQRRGSASSYTSSSSATSSSSGSTNGSGSNDSGSSSACSPRHRHSNGDAQNEMMLRDQIQARIKARDDGQSEINGRDGLHSIGAKQVIDRNGNKRYRLPDGTLIDRIRVDHSQTQGTLNNIHSQTIEDTPNAQTLSGEPTLNQTLEHQIDQTKAPQRTDMKHTSASTDGFSSSTYSGSTHSSLGSAASIRSSLASTDDLEVQETLNTHKNTLFNPTSMRESTEWSDQRMYGTTAENTETGIKQIYTGESKRTSQGGIFVQPHVEGTLPEQALRGFVIYNQDKLSSGKVIQTDSNEHNVIVPSKEESVYSKINGDGDTIHEKPTEPIQKLNGFSIDNTTYENYYGISTHPKTTKLKPLQPTKTKDQQPQHQSNNYSAKNDIIPYNDYPILPDINKNTQKDLYAPTPTTTMPSNQSSPIATAATPLATNPPPRRWGRKPPHFVNKVKDEEDKRNAHERAREKRMWICLIILIVVIVVLLVGIAVAIYIAVDRLGGGGGSSGNGNSGERDADADLFLCSNGQNVTRAQRCDGFEHCLLGEDERGCDCGSFERQCSESQVCILEDWFCDGVYDCAQQEDEADCGLSCTSTEFACRDHSECVNLDLRCDGNGDCRDGSDEWECARVLSSRELQAVSGSDYVPVCTDTFTDSAANATCRSLGFGSAISWEAEDASSADALMRVVSFDSESILFSDAVVCSSVEKVSLTCSYDECGTISPLISNGRRTKILQGYTADTRAWPWQAAIEYRGGFICGATLLSDQWLLTAAHCVEFAPNRPSRFDVRLGSIQDEGTDDGGALQDIGVEDIFMHEDYDDDTLENDIALLKLSSQVSYTDYVRPVCLPQSLGQGFEAAVECYTTGWGAYDDAAEEYPQRLQEARMNLIDDTTCANNAYIAEWGLYEDIMLCAGYEHGRITVCNGDSGGPLVCRDARNVWTLAGVTSWGPITDEIDCLGISVYTEVSAYIEWIDEIIVQN